MIAATRGSHRQFKHPSKPGRVTVPGKPSDELAPGTFNSIRKQARFKTPAAVMVDADGRIASDVGVGADAVMALAGAGARVAETAG